MGYPAALSVSHLELNNNNNEMTMTEKRFISPSPVFSDVSTALQASLSQAKEDGRITLGVYQAATTLENNLEDVMLCILAADDFNNLELHIHFTLLEAFCWENDISLVKVDSSSKLGKLLFDGNLPANDNDFAAGRINSLRPLDCVLIQFPKETISPQDKKVLDFYKASESMLPRPIIDLPE
ncbi:growth arrest and DNA damage-inducible protein GADD45 alpha [Lingula anatina]|uniref:Growth arrest and DNA damage-inducible protein GADD45 alpha n=1 Tax=Lingula anatina TaxID=7574 RepID=A0A1S3J8K5_LINAN|nr:growth arrest and DNA damage-inducible protein GADD45 alpha [Lingula anatina]|eukprot:XP_013406199.1 growth arrest and DNA damage-inducible protein GADD45 alpha [Lingula anatina]